MILKNCIIVHGSADDENDKEYNKHWMPWIKEKLEKAGIKVFAPNMPEPWGSDYSSWRKEFEKISDNINENSILVGHSRGTAFLVRWLGKLEEKLRSSSWLHHGKFLIKSIKKAFMTLR